METKDIPNRSPTPWAPITNPVDKKILGKLLEELGECTSAAARCLISGMDEPNPETGEKNRDWLEKEVADVFAMLDITLTRFGMNRPGILERASRKADFLRAWLAQPPTDGDFNER